MYTTMAGPKVVTDRRGSELAGKKSVKQYDLRRIQEDICIASASHIAVYSLSTQISSNLSKAYPST